MALFIVGFVVLLVVTFLLQAGLLVWVEKLFRIENPTYKNALKIMLLYGVASTIVGILFANLNLGLLPYLATIVVSFLAFHFLLKKYQQSNWKKSLGTFVVFAIISSVISLAIVVTVRLNVFEPFVISGDAMSPTYVNDDYLLINKFSKEYKRGDVVVLQSPVDSTKFFIERIIALPSETVDIKAGQLFINGQVLSESYYTGETSPESTVTLGDNQYFVLGDNRGASSDSRTWGPVTKENILGKVFYKAFNLSALK